MVTGTFGKTARGWRHRAQRECARNAARTAGRCARVECAEHRLLQMTRRGIMHEGGRTARDREGLVDARRRSAHGR